MSNQKLNHIQESSPYTQEDVAYPNPTDGITIAGTLTMPSSGSNFPAVLLISGMGPNDRDYTMFGQKLFLQLADYLTRYGVAVLRVDKRGVGKSTGTFDATVTSQDLARDVQAGVDYLATRSEIDPHRIGLVGHSEGGMIAAMVASQTQKVSFVVFMAGVMTTAIEHVLAQVAMQLKADGASKALIDCDAKVRNELLLTLKEESDPEKAIKAMRCIVESYFASLPEDIKNESEKYLFAIKESTLESILSFFNSPGYRYWLEHDVENDLHKLQVPVLAITGDLDFVTASGIHLPVVKEALKQVGNSDATIVEMANMNHWLQSCRTGAMREYGELQEGISPNALKLIADWIIAKCNLTK